MTQEVTRRHYLDAMGITSWASRYQLPNALPTDVCEWQDAPAKAAPRERLQALLDDAPAHQTSRQPGRESDLAPKVAASPSAVKALLGQPTPAEQVSQPEASTELEPTTQVERAEPLTFSLSCACIDGRWLSLCEGEISAVEQQLLANMLRAAGIGHGELPTVTHFTWPPMATAFEPEEPLEEAQEGVAAFIAGAVSRQGWQLEQVLWWGAESATADLERVIALDGGHSETLALPVWQGPSLAALTQDANAKRALWPRLVALGKQWGDA
ncbi:MULTISPECIES: hypothetical protein [Halomonadaceae]|uniref:hypothetical protein n=1 Tax=Halomonadaceae TaxID=28256 RepID=UPI001C626340|nr:hypothetical protein [Halomonas piezotolerans]MCG7589883.1 hypothetical protein [Halomonas sp. McD50-5]MCG7616068.1 hypothetical protein [Halomonas sp. McD50-4]